MTLIDDIKRDREVGTPGDWRLGSWQDNVFGTGPNGEWISICRVKRDNAPIDESIDAVDARRIARVPQMEAALLAADKFAQAWRLYDQGKAGAGEVDFRYLNFRKALEADQ